MRSTHWLPGFLALVFLSCAPRHDPRHPGQAKKGPDSTQPFVDIKPRTDDLGHLKKRLAEAISDVKARPLGVNNAFWTIFHGILGSGLETQLVRDGEPPVNALEWIRAGNKVRGLEFIAYENGLDVRTATPSTPDLMFVGQGHQDQFIAEMIQIGLPQDAPFKIQGKEYRFADFCRYAKARASLTKNQELSWAVIVVGHVYGLDHAWTNELGEKLTLEDMVRYELDQPIEQGAACGGTHRLFGLTWVYNLHRKNGGKDEGVWKDVAAKLQDYRQKAYKFRNGDGSFSTKYFAGAEQIKDMDRRINTTGHIFEWLALTLPDRELTQPWVQEAAYALAKMILDQGNHPIDAGSLYHAAHGLNLYYDRLFGQTPPGLPLPPHE